MRLDLNALTVESFNTVAVSEVSTTPATGPEGPYSYCWICRPSDPGVPGCDLPAPVEPQPLPPYYTPRSFVVDSICLCYA